MEAAGFGEGVAMGMRSVRAGLWLWVMTFAGIAPALSAEPPPIPDKPEAEQFRNVPAPWRDYLIQARAAERIADPLQRCLAFPDLPGNHWPAGHAAAHCRIHYAMKPITPADIDAMLDRGELAQLEKLLDERLQLHFSKAGFSEIIHDDLNFWVDDAGRNGRIAEKWLKLAPKSAYANAAYASFLFHSAWKARGEASVGNTPRTNFARMSELAELAIPYFEKAISQNRQLLPAYEGLVNLAMLDSRHELGDRVFMASKAIDPACAELAGTRMKSLQPRWGGSYEQMLAYANELSGRVAERPQLAVYLARPYGDRGDRMLADKQFTAEAKQVFDTALNIGSDEDALRNAARAVLYSGDDKPDSNQALVYLLQEARFRGNANWGLQQIAWSLVRLEPEWSLKYSLLAIQAEPDEALSHYLAGAGYYNTRHYEDADREYRIAIEDDDQRQKSLREVAEMWLWSGDQRDPEARKLAAIKAKPYIDRLISEFPEDGRGMAMRLWQDGAMNGRIMIEDMRALLPKLDRTDPWQAREAKRLEEMVSQVDKMRKTTGKNR